jgi:biofilm PGA synthesis N-glycosyltransferase PgaC
MDSVLIFILVWGVWLITPILVDGIDTLSRLWIVRSRRVERRTKRLEDDVLPTVSIVVPAHNEAAVIDRCLNSVKAQDYPHDKLEIIVVDDGSTDETVDRVEEHVNGNGNGHTNGNGNGHGDAFRVRGRPIKVGPFSGRLTLIKNGHGGKAHALNAGIEASTGEIIVNIDSDVVLAQDAIRAIASAFARDPEIGALTGNIEIDWELVEERDGGGDLVLDANGDIVPKKLRPLERLIAKCQFLEYLASFDLGRRSQGITATMYTLAGACSAFRREVLHEGCRYENTTVSEDTCLTFQLHREKVKVGFAHDARVYVEPVTDWDALYAQRARWSRGQLEVCGLNDDIIGSGDTGSFGRTSVPKMLLLDHTMAFPRLIWAPLILFFPLLGYSINVIALALVGMYVFYTLIELANTAAVHSIADDHTRPRIEECSTALLAMPAYRFVVFHFRFSGFLVTLLEEQRWDVPGPRQRLTDDLEHLRLHAIRLASATVTWASGMRALILAASGVASMWLVGSLVQWMSRIADTSRTPR